MTSSKVSGEICMYSVRRSSSCVYARTGWINTMERAQVWLKGVLLIYKVALLIRININYNTAYFVLITFRYAHFAMTMTV